MDSEKIRILIVDDHPLFRDGMHGLLDSVEEPMWLVRQPAVKR